MFSDNQTLDSIKSSSKSMWKMTLECKFRLVKKNCNPCIPGEFKNSWKICIINTRYVFQEVFCTVTDLLAFRYHFFFYMKLFILDNVLIWKAERETVS